MGLTNHSSAYIYTNIVERKHNNKIIQNQDFLYYIILEIIVKNLFLNIRNTSLYFQHQLQFSYFKELVAFMEKVFMQRIC